MLTLGEGCHYPIYEYWLILNTEFKSMLIKQINLGQYRKKSDFNHYTNRDCNGNLFWNKDLSARRGRSSGQKKGLFA